jgi:hypothetical protein
MNFGATLNGLVKRWAALAGEIEPAHETLRKMVQDLENLDATIVQFNPDFRLRRSSQRASVRRPIGAPGPDVPDHPVHSAPLTSRDIALQLFVESAG